MDKIDLVLKSLWAQRVPTIIPKKADTPTANVAMYRVIRALSQYSDKAINNIKLNTTKADRIPPMIYPAPVTKNKVDITGIFKYDCFIGPRTEVNKNTLKAFK